jgi:hypothetical protein
MDINRARALIGHWPTEAQYILVERWGMTPDNEAGFWSAVDNTRLVWGETWGRDVAATQLRIENEEKEKTQWNKLQAALVASRQQRLY